MCIVHFLSHDENSMQLTHHTAFVYCWNPYAIKCLGFCEEKPSTLWNFTLRQGEHYKLHTDMIQTIPSGNVAVIWQWYLPQLIHNNNINETKSTLVLYILLNKHSLLQSYFSVFVVLTCVRRLWISCFVKHISKSYVPYLKTMIEVMMAIILWL